jgi:hypothetical protein
LKTPSPPSAPTSPAHWQNERTLLAGLSREPYAMFLPDIKFNHESSVAGYEFVTFKSPDHRFLPPMAFCQNFLRIVLELCGTIRYAFPIGTPVFPFCDTSALTRRP